MPDDEQSACTAVFFREWFSHIVDEVDTLDRAVFATIVATPTPTLDAPLRSLGKAANKSKLWVGTALVIAAVGGKRGRRAALVGLASVGAASAAVNLAVKHGVDRPRPGRTRIDADRQLPIPESTSFPSGHSASAFAFAVGTGTQMPVLALPLNTMAALVAYSRVHSAVHYPSDVMAGAAIGGAAGSLVSRALRLLGRRVASRRRDAKGD